MLNAGGDAQLTNFGWCKAHQLVEHSGEVVVVGKAYCQACISHRSAVGYHVKCGIASCLVQIVVDGDAGVVHKSAAHMGFGDPKLIGQLLQTEVLGIVLVNIGENAVGVLEVAAVVRHAKLSVLTADKPHKGGGVADIYVGGVAIGRGGFFHHSIHHNMDILRAGDAVIKLDIAQRVVENVGMNIHLHHKELAIIAKAEASVGLAPIHHSELACHYPNGLVAQQQLNSTLHNVVDLNQFVPVIVATEVVGVFMISQMDGKGVFLRLIFVCDLHFASSEINIVLIL